MAIWAFNWLKKIGVKIMAVGKLLITKNLFRIFFNLFLIKLIS
ncbi:hypothetical protein [Spiroplasma endosymbiont of Dactylopius coccus]